MIILLSKTFRYLFLLLYSCICAIVLISSPSSTNACSIASIAVNTYSQNAPKKPIHNLALSSMDLPVMADEVERKAVVIWSPNPRLVTSEKQSVKSRTDGGKAHPPSYCTVPSSQEQHLFN